ncbi:hypothetical protein ACOSP7_005883 [Xanthoceras sorbifolium]|uniref:F-box domain-containing protein n=1 Tax=Xanthoceras sorbifolium TaxID=99658 RepID=A0ABQ8IDV2_9ROSI|nr:hypothetical protein JRO89_XS02G0010600 [Xanthoceras sorbifolium]
MKRVSGESGRGKKEFLLPDDVMIHIFLRFPVKNLAQFRCVCKSWNRVITSQPFFESLSNQTTSTCVLYHPCFSHLRLGLYSEKLQNFLELPDPPFGDDHKDFGIVGSCNGVLCLYSNGFDRSFIYMWNPTVRKYITLPKPSCNPRYLGFGINPKSGHLDDFKVVTIFANANAEVYSLRTNSWKSIADGFLPSIELTCCHLDHPVFLNGFVHWCAQVSCYLDSKRPWLIVSFDFANEVFQKIMLPDNLSLDDGAKFLNVVNGRLCVFAAADQKFSAYELWVMMEYGIVESWSRICTIEKPEKFWWPLGFTTTGSIFARGHCKHGENTLLVYRPDRKKFKCLGGHLPHLPIQVLTFGESVIAPVPQPVIFGTT